MDSSTAIAFTIFSCFIYFCLSFARQERKRKKPAQLPQMPRIVNRKIVSPYREHLEPLEPLTPIPPIPPLPPIEFESTKTTTTTSLVKKVVHNGKVTRWSFKQGKAEGNIEIDRRSGAPVIHVKAIRGGNISVNGDKVSFTSEDGKFHFNSDDEDK